MMGPLRRKEIVKIELNIVSEMSYLRSGENQSQSVVIPRNRQNLTDRTAPN